MKYDVPKNKTFEDEQNKFLQVVATFKAHDKGVKCLKVNQKLIISGSKDGEIKIFDHAAK